jgi:type II secretory pathway pseudopilin PulG
MITNPTKTILHTTPGYSQKGAVLIVSLMILLVLTILGISGLSGASLQERMAHNFQQALVAFQSAESAISRSVIAGNPDTNTYYVQASDPLEAARQAGLGNVITYANPDSYEADTTTTVAYLGGGNRCTGISFELGCNKFNITVTATIAATNTTTTHIQTVERTAPGGSGP